MNSIFEIKRRNNIKKFFEREKGFAEFEREAISDFKKYLNKNSKEICGFVHNFDRDIMVITPLQWSSSPFSYIKFQTERIPPDCAFVCAEGTWKYFIIEGRFEYVFTAESWKRMTPTFKISPPHNFRINHLKNIVLESMDVWNETLASLILTNIISAPESIYTGYRLDGRINLTINGIGNTIFQEKNYKSLDIFRWLKYYLLPMSERNYIFSVNNRKLTIKYPIRLVLGGLKKLEYRGTNTEKSILARTNFNNYGEQLINGFRGLFDIPILLNDKVEMKYEFDPLDMDFLDFILSAHLYHPSVDNDAIELASIKIQDMIIKEISNVATPTIYNILLNIFKPDTFGKPIGALQIARSISRGSFNELLNSEDIVKIYKNTYHDVLTDWITKMDYIYRNVVEFRSTPLYSIYGEEVSRRFSSNERRILSILSRHSPIEYGQLYELCKSDINLKDFEEAIYLLKQKGVIYSSNSTIKLVPVI